MLGFSQTSFVQKHIMAAVVSAIAAGRSVPSQSSIADDLTQLLNSLVTTNRVAADVRILKQLGCLKVDGRWGALGTTVVVPSHVAAQVTVWIGQDRARRGL